MLEVVLLTDVMPGSIVVRMVATETVTTSSGLEQSHPENP